MKPIRLGVVGATGMVGRTFLKLLEEIPFPTQELRLFSSPASAGKTVSCNGQPIELQTLSEAGFKDLDAVFFSAGGDISREWAPKAVAAGAFAIDNSSAFRMDPDTPLVVPEVNGHLLKSLGPRIIANPNCSTIQLVVAVFPLHQKFGIDQLRVATYQAVSGAGKAAQKELLDHSRTTAPPEKSSVFPKPIAFNCIPQIGDFSDDGFCVEESKLINETKKILATPELPVSAFTVRVPVINGHSEAVWVALKKATGLEDLLMTLDQAPGVLLVPDSYPTARDVDGRNQVFVGRIHSDPVAPNTWRLWVVADNLRKGAALNGLQIARQLFIEASG